MAKVKNKLVTNAYFPTLVFQITVADPDEMNRQLLELIYKDREKDHDGINRSNVKALGGWHSNINLHKSAKYAELVGHVNAATARISRQLEYAKNHVVRIGSMWSIINPPGSMNISHVHPGCMWSGVYYVQTPKGSGNIEFLEPRTAHLMNQPKFENKTKRPKDCWTKVNFKPIAGKMIIFPAWLYHSVRSNETKETGDKGNRVIMSFNMSQHKKKSK